MEPDGEDHGGGRSVVAIADPSLGFAPLIHGSITASRFFNRISFDCLDFLAQACRNLVCAKSQKPLDLPIVLGSVRSLLWTHRTCDIGGIPKGAERFQAPLRIRWTTVRGSLWGGTVQREIDA